MSANPRPNGVVRRALPVRADGHGPPPMFNLPPGVKSLILVLIVLHMGQHLMTNHLDIEVMDTLGYYPYRYWLLLHGMWAGPLYELIVTPVTYMFLHASWTHLGINIMSLAAFGTVVERLAGPRFMIWLFLLCGVIGAFTEFAVAPKAHEFVIGASAGISGLFAVAFLTLARQQKMSRGKLMLVICLMLLIMSFTGIAGLPGMPIAWVAHVGGFLGGIVAETCLNRRPDGNPMNDLGWFAAIAALPLFVLVMNISHYF